MIRFIPKPNPTAIQVASLRKISALGIAEICRAAESQTSVRDIVVFGNSWEEDRVLLRDLSRSYSEGNAAFDVCEVQPSGRIERLSPIDFESRLEHYRQIELEQQMDSDLESGNIDSHEEFEPHDENWL